MRFPFGITLLALLKGRDGFPAGAVLSDTLIQAPPTTSAAAR